MWYGAAGSNTNSCDLIAKSLGKGGGELVNSVEYSFCGNVDFLNSLYLWKTPQADVRRRPREHVHGLLGLVAEVDGDHRSVRSEGAEAVASDSIRPLPD